MAVLLRAAKDVEGYSRNLFSKVDIASLFEAELKLGKIREPSGVKSLDQLNL
jgi:hypothetical protein